MPQRPEDYQSTKNVGGNKLGGTDAGHNDPMAYLKTTSDHAYLGHFTGRKVLKDGHNFAAERISAARARRIIRRGGPRAEEVAAARPVTAAKVALRAARRMGPDAPGMAGARREAIAAARQQVQAARVNPESRRSERQARRQARRGSTYSRG
jgi:hypothetical protein